MVQVLIADDEPGIRSLIADYLDMLGFEPLGARDGEQALSLFREYHPQVVLTDVMMPGLDGISLLRAIKEESPETAVVVMTGFGSDDMAIQVLRAGAANYLRKPLQLSEVGRIIRKCLKWFLSEDQQVEPEEIAENERISFLIDNDPAAVPNAVRLLWRRCEMLVGAENAMPFRCGLEEIMLNAIEHGNLGIQFLEKASALEKDEFDQLISERRQDPRYSPRKIHVEMSRKNDVLRFRIRDEGAGFDWQEWFGDPKEEHLPLANGRGIFLARIHFHEIVYNEKGNEVTLSWHVGKSPYEDEEEEMLEITAQEEMA